MRLFLPAKYLPVNTKVNRFADDWEIKVEVEIFGHKIKAGEGTILLVRENRVLAISNEEEVVVMLRTKQDALGLLKEITGC